jgi:hypothetical protein
MRITRDTVSLLILGAASSLVIVSEAFSNPLLSAKSLSSPSETRISAVQQNPADASFGNSVDAPKTASRFCKARELIKSLVEEEKCFSTEAGAQAFGDVCAINIVYEDCFEAQPIVGKTVRGTSCATVPSLEYCIQSLTHLFVHTYMIMICSTFLFIYFIGCDESHVGQSCSAQRTR